MVFTFLMGIVFALCQHILYSYLHHTQVEDEVKKFRWVLYGRALAYCAKVAFGGCVILVFRQRIWRVFRDRALSVFSIDQFFGATEDPTIFGNWEAVSTAPFVVAIAAVIWLIPLATIIFSPGALTFGTFLDEETVTRSVPVINFQAESNKDWRTPVKMPDGSNKRSVMYYNTTNRDPKFPGIFDWYDQPSAELKRIALLLAYNNMNHPNVMQGARQNACGGAYNCTYEQRFIGPGYQCTEVARGINDTGRLKEFNSPFKDTSLLAPTGSSIYLGNVDLGAYGRPQNATFEKGVGGIPINGIIPDDLGVFKSEPVLWMGYSVNTTKELNTGDPLTVNWTHLYEPRIIRCVHMETEYTVKWNWTEPFFHSMVKPKYLAPIVNTNITLTENGTQDFNVAPIPLANQISPRTNVPLYKKTAAYHALGDMFRDFLRGHVDLEPPYPGPSYATVWSDITKTRLVDKFSAPQKDLGVEIEAFYTDMVLSLLSAPEMLVVGNDTTVVKRSRLLSSFVYVPERLWQCYAPVIFITLLIFGFGALTIWEDGTTFSTGFSRILVTTRNTTLDDISRGACLGNDPFPLELMNTRLKFGALLETAEVEYVGGDGYQGVSHCAFGVESEVGPIRKGIPYAGLKKRNKRQKVEIESN
ncbi:hypothetical protein GQ44DRAFT_752840 [Phaeosphaeriaceae sp. PMI808]|nr:hypothetical protein GQ44DRAFT_752840 [Phaeosphaeriaceae sp. PMI808]